MAAAAIILYFALMALAVYTARASRIPPPRIDSALHAAARRYGVSYWDMRTVSSCESVGYTDFYNERSGATGLFQFLYSTWLNTPYRRYDRMSMWANAMAAAWLVRQDGGWGEWVCQP